MQYRNFIFASAFLALLVIMISLSGTNFRAPAPEADPLVVSSANLTADGSSTESQPAEPGPALAPVVLIGAGDISVCGTDGAYETAALIDRLLWRYPLAQIFTAGDNAQSMGLMSEYTQCFEPTWGRFMNILHPSPGNHDWFGEANPDGWPRDYFAYFGEAAGGSTGYYSYDLGGWHIVALNTNCDSVGCDAESEQAAWLRSDLEQSSARCTLLYWHHPLRSSGFEATPAAAEFWRIASENNADIVVNGHDHHYERFAPLDINGQLNRRGIRSFIVGTGGAWLFPIDQRLDITDALDNETRGVIVFTLFPDRYTWEFAPVDGGSFTDYGQGQCE